MRICLYTETALPKMGGQELVVDALARQFLDHGHHVVVLAPHPRRPLRAGDASLPYPVVRHPRFFSTRRLVPWYRRWLLELFRVQKFDLLHCHGIYPPGYLAALSRQQLAVPILITSHGGDVHDGSVRLSRSIVRQRHVEALEAADVLVAISRHTVEGYKRLCRQPRRVVAIPNGVDCDALAAAASRPADLNGAIVPGNYFFFLGRLKRRKGVDVLLDALAMIHPKDRVQVVIAGDGEERQALESQAQRLGVANHVHFLGMVSGEAKVYLLQNALCTLVPSRVWEAFGLVVLESYAAGTPVIGTRMPGLEDLIYPEQTGLVVQPESAQELARAILWVSADPARCAELGRRAYALAQEYSWAVIARRHLELYQELTTTTPLCQPA